MSYICDKCGHEFDVPKLVESGGEYGGNAHKEPVSPCCEYDFQEAEELGNGSGVYEVGEIEFRQLIHLIQQNSSTKAECLVVSPNFINTLLAVVAVN